MNHLNHILIVFLFLVAETVNSQCPDAPDNGYSYCLEEISIQGASNVNSFSFSWENSLINMNHNIIETITNCEKNESENLNFYIPLQSFKGGNRVMRDDFLQLLKAAEYPVVTVGLDKIEPGCDKTEKEIKNIELSVTLAGVQKKVKAYYTNHTDSQNRQILSGSASILLTDFQIDPPEKAMGLIRVKNEVFIKFDIVIQNSVSSINQALN